MKLREGDAWMSADDYGRSLKGLGINLLVEDTERAVAFQTSVLAAEVIYTDPDFAVLHGYGAEWMLHADHTYDDHELYGSLRPDTARGIGVELRFSAVIWMRQRPVQGRRDIRFWLVRWTSRTGCVKPTSSTSTATSGCRMCRA